MEAAALALAAAAPAPTYTSLEVARLAGITYRQLDYWIRRGVLAPANASVGPGWARAFTEHDLVAIAACARLSELGGGTRVMRHLVLAIADVDLASLPRVAAVDAEGRVVLGPGLELDELIDSWLVLVDHPGRR